MFAIERASFLVGALISAMFQGENFAMMVSCHLYDIAFILF